MKLHRKVMKKMLVLSAIAVLSLSTAVSADALTCTYDGYVAMGGMVFNNTNSYLLPSNSDSPPTGPPQNMETFGYAFLKVDLSGLSEAVGQAELQLDAMALQDGMSWPETGTANVGAYAVSADVAGIDGSTASAFRDSIAALPEDFLTMTDEELGIITLDVTDIVNEWISSGNNYGLVLASTGGLMPRLHSSETVGGVAPVIITSAIPEPMSMSLLACGALGLLLRRKRNG